MLKPDDAQHPRIGIALISAATLSFAVLDACAKWLVQSLPVVQVVWLRFVIHVLLMAALLLPTQGTRVFRVHSKPLMALRALMLCSMTGLNFAALQFLQLAETAAMQFSVPILIALFSAALLGERIGPLRWLAIVAGFVGVLLIIRPGGEGFHPAILLSALNALIYAAFNMLTRRMAGTESPEAMQWFSGLGAALVLTPFALVAWVTPTSALQWTLLVVCGLTGGLGHQCVAMAHRYASAAVLGPFLYQQILYMSAWGWLVFAQVPDAFVVAGAAVVIGSGLLLGWLETRRGNGSDAVAAPADLTSGSRAPDRPAP